MLESLETVMTVDTVGVLQNVSIVGEQSGLRAFGGWLHRSDVV